MCERLLDYWEGILNWVRLGLLLCVRVMTLNLWCLPICGVHVICSQCGAGHSSGGRAHSCEGLDHQIDSAPRCICSLHYFGPVVDHQRLWYVVSCLWESEYKRPLAAYRKE